MKDPKPTTVDTQTEVNREIMTFFKELRVQSQNFHARSATGPTNTKHLPIDGPKSYTNLRGDFYCHNCTKQGHMSDNCPEPKLTYKQRMNNRRKIDELLAKNTGGVAPAASAQPSAENPLGTISGNAGRVMNSWAAMPAILRRNEKLPEDVLKGKALTVIGAATRSQGEKTGRAIAGKPSVPGPTKITKPGEARKPSKEAKKVAEHVFTNRRPHDAVVKDVTEEDISQDTMVEDAPPLSVPSTPSKGKRVSFSPNLTVETEEADSSRRPPLISQTMNPQPPEAFTSEAIPQRKLSKRQEILLNDEEAKYDGPKKTISINMAKGKERFQVNQFLNFSVTLPIWQLLDRSPQIRAQLVRAMTSSKSSKRGKKSITSVSAGAIAGKSAAAIARAPVVETSAYDEEEMVCLYIGSWINDTMVSKTLVDTGAVVELINPKLVAKLELEIHTMEEELVLQLADDGLATVKKYV